MQVFQTPDHVVIFNEMVHDARIIPLAPRAALPDHVRQRMGDSRGRWDGDTLVIDTRHFYYDYNSRGTSAQMKLQERITRIDENTLDYDFTIEDPLSWDVPWSARMPLPPFAASSLVAQEIPAAPRSWIASTRSSR